MQNGLKRIRLQVDGITCAGCAEDMEKILLDRDGVSDVSVNYAEGTINIEYDPEIVNEKDIFIAVRRLGFKTRII